MLDRYDIIDEHIPGKRKITPPRGVPKAGGVTITSRRDTLVAQLEKMLDCVKRPDPNKVGGGAQSRLKQRDTEKQKDRPRRFVRWC